MRGDPGAYELVAPRTLDEALALLAAQPGELAPLAGGTDLMVLLAAGRLPPRRYLSLWRLDELRGVREEAGAITLGALTTFTEVRAHPTLQRELPMLCQAAAETGGWAIQNRGTLGGNIANASPAADSPPALLAYGAELELVSRGGARWVDYATFHTGYKTTVRRPDELIARVRVGRPTGRRVDSFRKVGPRRAQAISKVCLAASAELAGGVVTGARVAFGGVAPAVVRCPEAERLLVEGAFDDAALGRARAALAHEIAPIDDVRSTARYRRRIAEKLLDAFVGATRAALAR